MEKKEMKWYEAPEMEIVELGTTVSLLAGSDKVGFPNEDMEVVD